MEATSFSARVWHKRYNAQLEIAPKNKIQKIL
jgi:hypothetical protein